jgi:uncharacterized protein YneF (UPF0154 family)
MNRTLRIIGTVFTMIGILLLVVAGLIFGSAMRFKARALAVDGQVTGMIRTFNTEHGRHHGYKPVVVFTSRDGKVHKVVGRVATYPPLYHVGQSVKVLYDPADPNDVNIGSLASDKLFLAYIPGGIGIVFCLVGGSFIFYLIRRRRVSAWLAENGTLVQATIEEVYQDMHVRINGKNPWRVRCRWQDPITRNLSLFVSESIEGDRSRYAPGSSITVRVNPENPKQYRVMLE